MDTIKPNKYVCYLCCLYLFPKNSITFYSKKLNITYSHLCILNKLFLKNKLIYKEKINKRTSKIILTGDGEELSKSCIKFKSALTKYIL